MLHLDDLSPVERLPRLVRWLSALRTLFTAPCANCQKMLRSAGGNPLQLLLPTVRTANSEAFHAECYKSRCGINNWETGWIDSKLVG